MKLLNCHHLLPENFTSQIRHNDLLSTIDKKLEPHNTRKEIAEELGWSTGKVTALLASYTDIREGFNGVPFGHTVRYISTSVISTRYLSPLLPVLEEVIKRVPIWNLF